MKKVRLYDFQTRRIAEIPSAELAPGFASATLEGVEGKVFVNAGNVRHSPYRHGRLTEDPWPQVFEFLSELLAEVRPKAPSEWEDGFRCDCNPDREASIWINIAKAYRYFTSGKQLGLEMKRDIFDLILAYSVNGPFALETTNLRKMTREEAQNLLTQIPAGGASTPESNTDL
ncbi:MAG: hypothetical protein H0U23_01680 [Blastocatellia bacterium]|nr:hypothetical protein [Blastocatellia bacterium]